MIRHLAPATVLTSIIDIYHLAPATVLTSIVKSWCG